LQRLQFLRVKPGDLRKSFAETIEAHHLRLEIAEAKRHRVEMSLDHLLRLLRFFPLIGKHDRLQPRVLRRGRVTQRDEVEYQGKADEQDE
jgi:hypothetical protein